MSTARPGRVLIMDDRDRWRRELRAALTPAGYDIETVASRPEALQRFAEDLFHVLVLDIRMQEGDVGNQEGLDMLEELGDLGRSNAARVVMCSGYGTRNRLRQAYARHGVDDFIDKGEFTDEELVSVVGASFEKLAINLALEIHWQGGLDVAQAVHNLLIDGSRVKRDTRQHDLLARELTDLLCRLFHEADSLLVEPIAPGLSGASVLLARPFYPRGAGHRTVVKYGAHEQIESEFQNFRTFVRPFVGGGRSTNVLELRRTPRLGGVVYSFLGASGEQLCDFGAIYRTRDIPTITAVIDDLFETTCASWYANLGSVSPLDLTDLYRQSLGLATERIGHAIGHVKSVHSGKTLHFNHLSVHAETPNPIRALTGTPRVEATYECVTHGDLNPRNILVDDDGHTWLIDFQQTGPGHLLRDLILLDCAVRFELLGTDEATLDERHALEQALLDQDGFPTLGDLPSPPDTRPPIAKAFSICSHLRARAGKLLASNPSASVDEFHTGALYCALKHLRFYRAPPLSREHALLSAAMLTARLF